MMTINRQNYERYFLDYLEGRLDDQYMAEMSDFLDRNPDLLQELEKGLMNIEPSVEETCPDKESLQKQLWEGPGISAENVDEWIVASLEGDLPREKTGILHGYLENHQEKQRDYYLFSRVFLTADQRIRFPNKADLRKGIARVAVRRLWPYVAAAASILLLMVFYLSMNPRSRLPQTSTSIATITSPPDTTAVQSAGQQVTAYHPESADKELSARTTITEGSKKAQQVASVKSPVNEIPENPKTSLTDFSDMGSKELLAVISSRQHQIPSVTVEPELHPLTRLSGKKAKVGSADDYLSIKQLAIAEFKKEVLKEDLKDINPDRFSLWDIANAGLQGVNKITGWNMALKTNYDSEGNLDNLAFNSKLLNVSHTAKK